MKSVADVTKSLNGSTITKSTEIAKKFANPAINIEFTKPAVPISNIAKNVEGINKIGVESMNQKDINSQLNFTNKFKRAAMQSGEFKTSILYLRSEFLILTFLFKN